MWQRRAHGPSLPLDTATDTFPQNLLMVVHCVLHVVLFEPFREIKRRASAKKARSMMTT